MHLQQTKAESRASGGPQYYFHDAVNLPDHIDIIELPELARHLSD